MQWLTLITHTRHYRVDDRCRAWPVASSACKLPQHGWSWYGRSHVHPAPRHEKLTSLHAECLREIGIEEKAREVAWPVSEYSTYTRFCKTLVGEEIYRAHVFGNDPHRHVRQPVYVVQLIRIESDSNRVTTLMPVHPRRSVSASRISSRCCWKMPISAAFPSAGIRV